MGDTHRSLDPGLGQRDTGSLEDTDTNMRMNPRNNPIGDMRSWKPGPYTGIGRYPGCRT